MAWQLSRRQARFAARAQALRLRPLLVQRLWLMFVFACRSSSFLFVEPAAGHLESQQNELPLGAT